MTILIQLLQQAYHYLQHHRKICYVSFSTVEAYGICLLVEAKGWIFGQITWAEVMSKINLIGDIEQVLTNWVKVGGGAVVVIIINKYFPKLLTWSGQGVSRWKQKRRVKKLRKKYENAE